MTCGDSLNDVVPPDPLAELLGVDYEAVGEGRIRGKVTVRPEHRNPFGAVHGALVYAMADTAMGRTLATLLDGQVRCATLTATVQYFEAARGDELLAASSLVHRGDKVATLGCNIHDGTGSLGAVATATFYISSLRKRNP